jgi:hypothetical protein
MFYAEMLIKVELLWPTVEYLLEYLILALENTVASMNDIVVMHIMISI